MRKEIAITKNVQKFLQGVELVNTPIKGRIGIGLFYGPPGTGKSEVSEWYAARNDVAFVRSRETSSRRSLLALIVSELGMVPFYRADDILQQIVDELIERPRALIIDEVDYLMKTGAIEVLRDINDMTNSPVILIGMEYADKKLRLYRHLYDRLTAIVRFGLFDKSEIANLAKQECSVPLTKCAVEYIEKESQGKLRLTMTYFVRAEQLAAKGKLEAVSARHLQSIKGK